MVKKIISFSVVIFWAAWASNCGVVTADDIRIDVSNFVSTTAGNWNNIDSNGTFNLIDFNTGAATGVTVTGDGWLEFFGDVQSEFVEQDWVVSPATEDGAGILDFEVGTFEFDGLANGSYRVEVVSARTDFEYLNFMNIDGALADSTFLGSPVNNPWNAATDGLDNSNWLIWSDVEVVDGSFTFTNTTEDTLGIVNAIRITSNSQTIPEPTSVIVLTLSLAMLAHRRR